MWILSRKHAAPGPLISSSNYQPLHSKGQTLTGLPFLFAIITLMSRALAFAIFLVTLTGCSKNNPETTTAPPRDENSPDLYRVMFDTTKGPFVVEVHRDWAPLGSDRFYTLVKNDYFSGAKFFRVIPNFMAQFGLAANPSITARYEGTEFQDDPVRQSNTRGMVTFATRGPNSRTTQMFINFGNNARLDQTGFTPFGQVISGMENVDRLYNQYGNAPDQTQIKAQGNKYLEVNFPQLDTIKTTKFGG